MDENCSHQSQSKQATSAVNAVSEEISSPKLNSYAQLRSPSTHPTTNCGVAFLSNSENYESDVELAIDVFEAHNPSLIKALKDFFLSSPSPIYVEQVLTTAVYRLADVAPDTCRWLLRNPSYLMPELDLVELASKLVISKLKNSVFIPKQDFSFQAKGPLEINELAKAELLHNSSLSDRLIINEVLQIF